MTLLLFRCAEQGKIVPVNDQGDLSTQIVQPWMPLSISNGVAWRCFQQKFCAEQGGLVPVNDQGNAHTARAP